MGDSGMPETLARLVVGWCGLIRPVAEIYRVAAGWRAGGGLGTARCQARVQWEQVDWSGQI